MGQVVLSGLLAENKNAKDFVYVMDEGDKFGIVEVAKANIFGKDRMATIRLGEVKEKEELFPKLVSLLKDRQIQKLVVNPNYPLTKEEKAFLREFLKEKIKNSKELETLVRNTTEKGIEVFLEEKVGGVINKLKEKGMLDKDFSPDYQNSIVFRETAMQIAEKFLKEHKEVADELKDIFARSVVREMGIKGLTLKEAVKYKEKKGQFENYAFAIFFHFKNEITKHITPKTVQTVIEDLTGKNFEEVMGMNEKFISKRIAEIGEQKTEKIREEKARKARRRR
jgi:hypothetical protein